MSDYQPDGSTAREDLCRFLAACFYEPTPDFSDADMFASMVTAAKVLGPHWEAHAAQLKRAFEQDTLETLLVDYTRLFLGPMKALAPPYGTSWQKNAESTEDNPPPSVLALYEAGGFEMDETFMERPDHVAVELEFLYALIYKTHQATRAGNAEDQAHFQQLQQRLLAEELGAWVGPFTEAMARGAETDFYQALAAFCGLFVAQADAPLALH